VTERSKKPAAPSRLDSVVGRDAYPREDTMVGDLADLPASTVRPEIVPPGVLKGVGGRLGDAWEEAIEGFLDEVEKATDAKSLAALLKKIAAIFRDKLGDDAQAFDGLLAAFRADPTDLAVVRAIEELARGQSRFQEVVDAAARLVEREAALGPERELHLCELIARWLRDELKNPAATTPFIARIKRIDPTHPAVQRRMADLFGERGAWEAQKDALERALLRAPDAEKKDGEMALGALFEKLVHVPRHVELARSHYERARALDEAAFEPLEALERIYRADDKYAELVDVLEAQVDAAPDNKQRISTLLRLAAVHEHQFVKPQQAASKLELVLALDPVNTDAFDGLERAYRAMRAWDELVRLLESRAEVALTPSARARIHAQIAEIHESKKDDIDAAIAGYVAASRADPSNKRAAWELARLSEKKKDYPAAAAYRAKIADLTKDPVQKATIFAAIGEMLLEGDRDPMAARVNFERAVAIDCTLVRAWEAIQLHAERAGDEVRAADCLAMRALYTEPGRLKAQLYVELGALRGEALGDTEGAYKAFDEAWKADPTNEIAARAVLDEYVARGHLREATPVCELLLHAATRDGDLERAHELFEIAAQIATANGDRERALGALIAAFEAMPGAAGGRDRLIEAAHGLRQDARLLGRTRKALEAIATRNEPPAGALLSVDHLVMLASSLRALGDEDHALELLQRATAISPHHEVALGELAEVHAARGEWDRVATCKRKQALGSRDEDEQFRLYAEAGEILAHKARDLEAALSDYEEARALRPDDHWLLHTLLWLYGQMERWGQLAKTLRAIADVEVDPLLRAKSVFAMAQVVRDKVLDPRWAADLFEEVIDLDPRRLDAFERIVRIYTELRDWRALESAYASMLKRLEKSTNRPLQHAVCHQLGLLYRDRLGDIEKALAAFRAALTLKPESEEDRKITAELFVVKGDIDSAIDLTRATLRRDPHALEPARELYYLFLRKRSFDQAWCTVDVLAQASPATLNAEQAQFLSSYAPMPLADVPGTLVAGAWDTHILHPELDPMVTSLLRLVVPAVVRAKLAPVADAAADLGPRLEEAQDEIADTIGRAFQDAAEILGVPAPVLYVKQGLSTPVAIAPALEGALFVSRDLAGNLDADALAFLAGKYIALLQPALVARALFPSVSELMSLVRAAVRVASSFENPNARELESARFDVTLVSSMKVDEAEGLRTAVATVLQTGAKLDVKRWAELAELSASRAGLLLAGSVDAARRGNMHEKRAPGDLAPAAWWGELVLFAMSDTFAELRAAVGIGVGAET
jgi:tetratricopeptide (TPR) repeat protein